jgi:hypothetical protein
MFNFKFEITHEGNYEALIDRRFSNLDWSKERREKMGGEDIEGITLKIIIEPKLQYGEKYYTAELVVNDYHTIDTLGEGYTLKECKAGINDWFIYHFWNVAQEQADTSYWGDYFTEAKDYYRAWQRGETPHQQKQLEKLKEEA